jgi:carbonic anhydrase
MLAMDKPNLTSMEALKLLVEGNKRFVSGLRSVETEPTIARLKELAEKGQTPFAIVLTCSDSRVPTEMIFDRGLGDIFVIRVAGNVVAPSVIASVEFAALNFGTPICVVMGHSACGAVKAAVSAEATGSHAATRNLEKLVLKVRPAVRWALRSTKCDTEAELLHQATLCNVRRNARLLKKRSTVIDDLTNEQKLMVVSAYYDLHTGRVLFDDSEMNAVAAKRAEREEKETRAAASGFEAMTLADRRRAR